jgi:hypothetical protein
VPRIDWTAEITHVWRTLLRVQGDGYVPKLALATACGRRPSRIGYVVAMIRDLVPDAPLVSKREGYRITGDPVQNENYRLLVTRNCHTRFRRWLTGSGEPFFQRLEQTNPAQAAWLRQHAAQFEAALELAVRTTLDGQ